MNQLPILISIPHGGNEIPIEVNDRVLLSPEDQFADGDSFTRDIYGIEECVSAFADTNIARAYVDLNRDVGDRPPENPDGIFKTKTCLGKPIYKSDSELDETLIDILLKNYYEPYHQKIRKILESSDDLVFALDCHSMEAFGPKISPDPGQPRPKFCLGNNHEKSCSSEITLKFSKCLQEAFDLDESEVMINKPFAGGFITRTYGMKPIPWLQIEMNRNFYLNPLWFDSVTREMDADRLEYLRNCFKKAIAKFFNKTID